MEGNQQKMREALENLTRFAEVDIRGLENLAKYAIDHSMYGGGVLRAVAGAIREGKNALSAPARNCDVGTDAEQAQRFERFCAAHHEEWKNGRPLMAWTCDCPCYQTGKNSCNHFTWAQMPYDAEAEGAK